MPDADKLRFLTGKYEDLANKAVTRGQVYFAIDGNDGKIVFDAPITATTTQRIIMSNKVDFANQAQSDSAGNEFISKYPYSFTTTSTGTSFQINIFAQNGDQISSSPITVPVASSTAAGIITNAAQDITGTKTFKTGLVVDASSGFNYSGIESGTSNSARPVWFAYAGTNGKPVYNTNFTYNPSTKTLKADKLDGLAAKATADGAGNIFISKYPYTLALDSEQTSIIIKAQNSDTLFTLSPRFLPLNGGHITGSLLVDDLTAGELVVNGVARIIDNLYANLIGNVTGNLIGNVTGNLTGLASQAAADSAGNNFIATYPYAFSQNTAKTNLIIKTPDGSDFGTYTFNFLPLTGGTLTGDLIIKKTTSDTNAYAGTGPQIVFQNSNASQNIKLLFSDYDTVQSPASLTLVGNQGGEYFIAPNIKATSKFYGNLEGNADTATLAATASVAKLIENTLFIGSEKSFTGAADVYIGETLYYVVGSESDAAGTWTGTNSAITSYYEGLTVIYVPKKAGASTTTLNINGLGAKTCYYTNTSKLTTHFAVNTPVILTYYNNGWRRADYDSNTNTAVRIYKGDTGTYPIIGSRTAAASITSGSTTVYGTIAETNPITITPSSGTVTATSFNGLATNASADELGNDFASTYPFSFALDNTNTQIVIKSSNGDDHTTLSPAFLPLAGGIMTGDITFSNADIGIKRVGRTTSWRLGRDVVLLKSTSISGYSPLISVKTKNGSWDIGAYDEANSYQDDLIFTYVTDAQYNGTSAFSTSSQIKFLENGHIVATLDGTATKAQQDSSGNEFISKYPFTFKETTSTTNYKITIKAPNGDAIKVKNNSDADADALTVPAASTSVAGLITTGSQTFAGLKNLQSSGEAGVYVQTTASGKENKLGLINGTGSGYSGLYSSKHSKWMTYIDLSGNAYFKGTADYTNAINGTPAAGDDEFTRVWFSYGPSSNAENEKKRAYDDTYKYNSGTHTLNVTQYRINDHGLIKYDAATESIVFSFV